LIKAARDEHFDAIRLLVEAGADVNVKKEGKCLLQRALERRHHEVVKQLIELGANIHATVPRTAWSMGDKTLLDVAIYSVPSTHWLIYREVRPPLNMTLEQYHH
jgi:hypothetical protein